MNLDFKNGKQVRNLKSELDKATKIIENSNISDITAPVFMRDISITSRFLETESLLSRCAEIVNADDETKKPVLRMIHHFACSGGSLLSKCLSSLPNVFLLSEVHPLSQNHMVGKPRYLPSDITSLARYARIPDVDELAEKLFIRNILETESFLSLRGGILLLREHTHIDFCLGGTIKPESTVENCLKEYFEIKHLVTVRNPIDSYYSLVANDWLQFSPPTFDEYCKRFYNFITRYPKENIIRYEDFVRHQDKYMIEMCEILDLPFDERYSEIFDIAVMTGDSGRKSGDIEIRERRPMEESFLSEVKCSESFKLISEILNYEKDI